MKLFQQIALALISVSLLAGNGEPKKKHGDKYCAKLKDGKVVVMHQENILTSDVTLGNGTQIKTDGTVIKKDGSRIVMSEGDCVDKEGKLEKPKETERPKDKPEKKNTNTKKK